jgi:hypothetical protein
VLRGVDQAFIGHHAHGTFATAPSVSHWLFTATPNDDGATTAMTTNCGQLSTPHSVIGAATLTTASHGAAREAPGAVGGKPTRTGGAQRRGAEAARQHCSK